MNKPEALNQLIEELRSEGANSAVETFRESKAVIYLSDELTAEDNGITLSADECRLVFANETTVERLLEALADPDDASLALFDVTLPDSMLNILECRFTSVDEG